MNEHSERAMFDAASAQGDERPSSKGDPGDGGTQGENDTPVHDLESASVPNEDWGRETLDKS